MKGKMKAAVKTEPAFGHIEIRDVDIPEIAADDVLVKVKIGSICGTDLHIYEWDEWSQSRVKAPLVQGHEWAGDVVDVGPACTWAEEGDYVSGEGHIACGDCYPCRTGNSHVCQNVKIIGIDRPGAFAEYLAVPEKNLIRNDPNLPLEYATIQDPFGNAVYTTFNADVPAKDVAIFGLGPIGLMAVALCRHVGAKRIFGVGHRNEYRIRLGKALGADRVIKSSEEDPVQVISGATDGLGVDEVLEMSGSGKALAHGLRVVKPAGGIHLLGIFANPVTLNLSSDFIAKGARMYGIHGRRMFEDWYRMQALFKSGLNLMPVITHKFPLEDIKEAMELMRSGNCGKVVLYP